jgi:D-glycero-alpha-D-manno-heptose-7-phosphate kinase
MSQTIAARSPLRISFAGGGTDVEPFSKEYGSAIVNATIDLYAEVCISKRKEKSVLVNSIETGERIELTAWSDADLKSHLVSACGLILSPEEREGLELSFSSPVAPGSGLGASSALVVAMTKALSVYSGNELSNSNLAIEAFNIERNHMKISGGFQDQYSSAHGGLNFLECKNEKINVEKISTSRDFILELESNLILADLSLPRTGQHIIEDQQKNFLEKKTKTVDAMKRQLELGYLMRDAFQEENLPLIGQLMNMSWKSKQDFSDKISNSMIRGIMSDLEEYGAIGSKITGAGGGGHMLILTNRTNRQRLRGYLASKTAIRDFAFSQEGAIAWRV